MVSWHLFVSCLTLCIANSLSIPRSHSNRATAKPLSDEIHYGGDSEHNPEFDHEAFLGEEEARHFDELSPEESKFRLGLLFDRIDTNSDGSLSTSELQDWITKIQFRYAEEDATKRWNEIMTTKKGKMEWDEYEFQNFGSKETIESSIDGSIKDMITKEKVRWKAADADEDGLLDKSEFSAFLHPESSKSMDDVVAQETLEEMDLDGDGFVDMKEFLNDLVGESDDDEEEDDVEWIETEKHNFKDNLDADHDGKLNKDELKKWLLSDDHEQIVEETEHLFNQADVNQDVCFLDDNSWLDNLAFLVDMMKFIQKTIQSQLVLEKVVHCLVLSSRLTDAVQHEKYSDLVTKHADDFKQKFPDFRRHIGIVNLISSPFSFDFTINTSWNSLTFRMT